MYLLTWIEDFKKDLRHGIRGLSANPLFTAVAILTLALGIGANTAIFSVLNAVVLRMLPVRDPQQLVFFRCTGQPDGASNTGDSETSFSNHVFDQMRRDKQAFSDVMAYVPLGLNKIAVRAGRLPEEASAQMVSGNYFTGLGVTPECGRLLTPSDESQHTATAVVSYGYWNRRFAHNCNAVGQQISINQVPLTIVGVAGPHFTGLSGDPVDVWIPLQTRPELHAWGMPDSDLYKDQNWWCLLVAARLAPGVSRTQAEAQANPLFRHSAYEPLGGKPQRGEHPTVLSLVEARGLNGYRDGFAKPLTMLLVMVGLILLIACGNVSLLLAARNTARRREFSVRLALGGSRGRLFRQLFTESLLLVVAGAVLGWLFAFAASRALGSWSGIEADLSPDWRVLLFTLAISLLAGLISGLAPLLGIASIQIGEALKTSAATGYRHRARTRTGQITTALQVALCLVLLTGAALLVRSLRNLETVNLGFKTEGLLVYGVTPHFSNHDESQAIAFYRELLDRMRSLPGVESVTLMQNRIGSDWSNNTGAVVDSRRPETSSDILRWNAVGPDYFQTLGVGLLYGRDINDADTQKSEKVAIVNQTFVNRFLKGRRALGHTVSFTSKFAFTIVGVAEDSKYTNVREQPMPMAYFPYTQLGGLGTMHVELRAAGNPIRLLPAVQRSLADYAPDLAMLQPMTEQKQFDESISGDKLIARLALFFGLLAVVLVATGLYGTIAYNVNRRTSELGIRIALGAAQSQVLWLILREGLLICSIGIAVGLPVAFGATRLLASQLYGLKPGDPLSMAAAILGILVVTGAACLIPARRAALVDPTVALRNE